MRRALVVALGFGALLLAADAALAPMVVRSEVVASLLSPGGLTLGRTVAALGYVALHVSAVFLGPALVIGATVGLLVDRLATREAGTAT